ncbi:MAG: hypothetical protein QM776_17050 [Rhodocyclaceae bacterium]
MPRQLVGRADAHLGIQRQRGFGHALREHALATGEVDGYRIFANAIGRVEVEHQDSEVEYEKEGHGEHDFAVLAELRDDTEAWHG